VKENFEIALKLVLLHEGGYVNIKSDPGGPTMRGVTQRVYDAYRDASGLVRQPVKQISAHEIADVYKRQYWDAVRGNELPAGLDYAVFDYAVNSGVNRAIKDLQRVFNLNMVDGIIGLGTIAAIKSSPVPVEDQITAYCNRRLNFMKALKTWKVFGKGWTRRVMGSSEGYQKTDTGVIDHAINMSLETPQTLPMPLFSASGKAEDRDKSQVKTPEGAGLGAGGIGVGGQMLVDQAQSLKGQFFDSPLWDYLQYGFIALMCLGFGLIAWKYIRRMKENGQSLSEILGV